MTSRSEDTWILGICAFHADSSAALIRNGELVAAVEEERFRRTKHWSGFPELSVQKCLEIGGIEPSDLTHIAIGRDPKANLGRKLWFTLSSFPSPRHILNRLRNQGQIREIPGAVASCLDMDPEDSRERTVYVEHHPAHLASSFFVSPFPEAAVCAVDGFGDFVSTSFGHGRGNQIEILDRVYYPHSLGMVYLAVTQFLGFPKYGSEYKVMGLAAYGHPTYIDEMRRVVQLQGGGRFELDLQYFRHWKEQIGFGWDDGAPRIEQAFTSELEELFGPARQPSDPLTQRHKDIAASLQTVFEDTLFHILNHLQEVTGQKRLCMAGGTAMNSVANGKVRANTQFEEVYIQPAAADNGTSLGAAFHVWNQVLGRPRRFRMEHALWGPGFTANEIDVALDSYRSKLEEGACTIETVQEDSELFRRTSELVASGNVVGWFQGRMEWGARALGNRTILADPRRADMRQIINEKIKFREEFRPFAPSILEEALDDYFVDAVPDPFMVQVYDVLEDKQGVIPAVTHVDGTGRLQTVNREQNPRYWKLLKAFEKETGVPVVLNTSFNENEPIVHRPEEAMDCFLRTDMDAVVLHDRLVTKG